MSQKIFFRAIVLKQIFRYTNHQNESYTRNIDQNLYKPVLHINVLYGKQHGTTTRLESRFKIYLRYETLISHSNAQAQESTFPFSTENSEKKTIL